MTDSTAATHAERLDELGGPLSTAEKISRSKRSYHAKVSRALDLYESMDSDGQVLSGMRAACLKALPGAVRNLIAIAHGRKGTPAVAQLKAIEMVAAGAGGSFEGDPKAAMGKLLSEMTLDELAQHLEGMRDSVQALKAIEIQGEVVPYQGSNDAPEPAQPGAAPA